MIRFFTFMFLSFFSLSSYSQTVFSDTLTTLAFGSCNFADRPLRYFKSVIENDPSVWIWLGDIVYANTEDVNVTKKKYNQVKNNKNYQHVLQTCKIIGVYDDHDFGDNNIGKEYKEKKESQKALLDFLDEPAESPRRKQEGVYWSYTFGPLGKQVKVILLDLRYFRDSPCDTSDILGETQWKWLEKEIDNSQANVTIIGSSVQFISPVAPYERWDAFPRSKKRLSDLLQKNSSKKIFFLSGDRHLAEISKTDSLKLGYPLYDFTSSGLTHFTPYPKKEKNPYLIGKLFIWKRNFGLLYFNWEAETLVLKIKKPNNKTLQETKLSLTTFQEIENPN